MASTQLRKRDTGEQGNKGQFCAAVRSEAAVDVPPAPQQTPGRELALGPELGGLATNIEASFDEEGRTVVAIGIARDQLPTSDYRVGSAPWEITDEEITDDQVDAYLEACSDDPETFGDHLGFPGEARWTSASSTLELTHTGYEGVGDEELSATVSATLGDFRNDLLLREWQ